MHENMKRLAEYAVPDFGGGEIAASGVYTFVAAPE